MPVTTTHIPKAFKDNHLDAGGLISPALIENNQHRKAWSRDVNDAVREIYAERGISEADIEREIDLEIESHLMARAKAVEELNIQAIREEVQRQLRLAQGDE